VREKRERNTCSICYMGGFVDVRCAQTKNGIAKMRVCAGVYVCVLCLSVCLCACVCVVVSFVCFNIAPDFLLKHERSSVSVFWGGIGVAEGGYANKYSVRTIACYNTRQYAAICCNMQQRAAKCCNLLQHAASCCNMMQCAES